MATTRAAEVAEILWELKRADKVASFSAIAERAGFSAGSEGRTVRKCLVTVRRDWPHLQWWRAVADNGVVENEEHAERLQEMGVDVVKDDKSGDTSAVIEEDRMMSWSEDAEAEAAAEPEEK